MDRRVGAALAGGIVIILACIGFGTACGGGGSDGGEDPSPDPPETLLQHLASDAALDGTVTSDGDAEADGSFIGPLAGDGDMASNGRVLAAYFSFNLATIPAGAEILDAELRLHQRDVFGTPYATHGHLRVQSVDYGPSLDGSDWGAPVFGSVDMHPATADLEDKIATVTDLLQDAVTADRPRFQVRVSFTDLGSDLDDISDAAHLVDAQDQGGTGLPPVLNVRHTVP